MFKMGAFQTILEWMLSNTILLLLLLLLEGFFHTIELSLFSLVWSILYLY